MKRHLFVRWLSLVGLIVALVPSLALAAEGQALAEVRSWLITGVGLVVGAILTRALVRAIKVFEKKTGIDVPDEWEAELLRLVPRGVDFAEEQARKALKNKKPFGGHEKLEKATEFVLTVTKNPRFRHYYENGGKAELKMMIESYLGNTRVGRRLAPAAELLGSFADDVKKTQQGDTKAISEEEVSGELVEGKNE